MLSYYAITCYKLVIYIIPVKKKKKGTIKGEISINEALAVVVVLVVFPQILQRRAECPTESSAF